MDTPDLSTILNNLSSFFEFMAGINAAFLISDEFTRNLVGKMTTVFSEILNRLPINKQSLDDIDQLMKDKSVNVKRNRSAKKNIKQIAEKVQHSKKRADDLGSSIEEYIKNFHSKKFSYISLFAMVYSVVILLIIGFDITSSYALDAFFTTNICIIAFLIIYLKCPVFFTPTYFKVLSYTLAIGIIVFIVEYTAVLNNWISLYSFDLKYPIKATSVIIPLMHFVYTLVSTFARVHFHGNRFQQEYNNLQVGQNECAIEVRTFAQFSSNIQNDVDEEDDDDEAVPGPSEEILKP